MTSKNFLNLKLASGLLSNKNASADTQLEAAIPQEQNSTNAKAQKRQRGAKKRSFNLLRIPQLLMLGYASEESTRRCVDISYPIHLLALQRLTIYP